jgi:hypothetical protein
MHRGPKFIRPRQFSIVSACQCHPRVEDKQQLMYVIPQIKICLFFDTYLFIYTKPILTIYYVCIYLFSDRLVE